MICKICGVDPKINREVLNSKEEFQKLGFDKSEVRGHECYCVLLPNQVKPTKNNPKGNLRIAVGICCGKTLGETLLKEEDFHDNCPWSVPEDCTCKGYK